jgi:hypothetical protein
VLGDLGGRRRISVGGALALRSTDIDYWVTGIRYRGSALEFGTGPHWGNGLPSAAGLEVLASVEERDVLTPDEHIVIAEYRGVRPNGTRWRYLGSLRESIQYDEADPIAAKYFDRGLTRFALRSARCPHLRA